MYIQPTSIVKILKNCPLDTTYDHTIFFSSKTDQIEYFNSLVKFTFNNQTYTRQEKGVIRVEKNAEELYDCNYLMFENERFGIGKWFYAFVTSVEYVNERVSNVKFDIDVMQTWAFDASGNPCYELADCVVERQHSLTDVAGDNIIAEDVDTGELVKNFQVSGEQFLDQDFSSLSESIRVCILSTIDKNQDPNYGTVIGGMYSGVSYNIFHSLTGTGGAQQWLESLLTNPDLDGWDSIIGCYVIPTTFDLGQYDQTSGAYNTSIVKANTPGTQLDGYVPRNKKLYTSPYNYLHVYTNANSQDFAYEKFKTSGNTVTFALEWNIVPSPTIVAIPIRYNDYGSNVGILDTERRLTLNDFPQCALNADAYKVYLSQNMNSNAVKNITSGTNLAVSAGSLIGTTAAIAGTILTGGALAPALLAAGVASGTSTISSALKRQSYVATLADVKRQPPEQKGSQVSSSDYNMGFNRFRYCRMSVRKDIAERIDKFFDMFGYAQKIVMKPWRCVRNYWTYLQTSGCDIHGSVPCDDMKKICSIYDNGITLWRYESGREMKIGDYTELAPYNTILSTPIH